MISKHFDCRCNNMAHTLRFQYDGEDMCASMFLDHYQPWYKRIFIGIRYMLGFKSKRGHFDYWMLKPEDAKDLQALVNDYLGDTSNQTNMGFLDS